MLNFSSAKGHVICYMLIRPVAPWSVFPEIEFCQTMALCCRLTIYRTVRAAF